jgi:CHASE3 domain sensor protein
MTLLLQPGASNLITARTPRLPAPVWIRVFAVVAAVAALAVALVLAAAAADVRDGLTDLGDRTAPQVTATEDLYFVLADMDAQLANVLLAGDDPGLADVRKDALDTFEQDRNRASADLQQAATAAGDDKGAQHTVRLVLGEFGRYQSLAAQAIQLDDVGRSTADVLSLQRRATDSMRFTLQTAHGLTRTNSARLDQSYQDTQDATVTARWWLGMGGAVLIGALVGLQVVLRVRMRRRLNLGTLAATLLAGWLVFGGIVLLGSESEHLRSAKQDAFDSLIALRQARAVSYDAKADESRYLLDSGRRATYGEAFVDKSELVAGVGAGTTFTYDDQLEQATKAYFSYHQVHITGFFGVTLENITFAGERQAAELTLSTYQTYQRADRTMRGMVDGNQVPAAIQYCIGDAENSSNHFFNQYDDALVDLIDINQRAFDTSVAAGESGVGGWTGALPYGVAALIIALVAAGVWPRLAEYR